MGNHTCQANDSFSGFDSSQLFRADTCFRRTFPRLTIWILGEKAKRSADCFSVLDSLVFHLDR